jgi:fatty-acyl-CoA synthase
VTAAPAQAPQQRRFWPPGVPHAAVPPRTTLHQRLAWVATQRQQHPAIVFGGSVLTYAALHNRVEALAGYLQQRLGLAPGDRVLLLAQNCPQWVVAFYAVLRAGAVVVPINPMCKPAEVAFHASDSGARLAIVAQELLPALALGDAAGAVDAAVVLAYADALAVAANGRAAPADDNQPTDLPDAVHATRQPLHDARLHGFEDAIAHHCAPLAAPTNPDALAVLPYTSGTTGHPKGCKHSHATLLASVASSAVWKRLHAGSVVLTVAPLFHMLGLQNGMNLPLWCGATAVMMPRWHAASAAALIERHRVTAWSAPPAMVLNLFSEPGTAQRDLSSLALLSGGGAAMPEAVAGMLRQRYGLNYEEAYGLTETASFLHANPPQRCKAQCLGLPTQGVDSRIIDPDTGRELATGEVGELVTHAPQVMLGYWGDSDRIAQANREAFITLHGQPYLRTGDLALVDDDGYFFLKDRLKRMINVSGYKVWPAEVENTLYNHPAVFEACVIAVPDDRAGRQPQGGDSVKALVVLKPGWPDRPSAQAFIAWCREHMAVYKAPRSVEFLAALPKSSSGKILWRELQQAHQGQEPIP